MVRRVWINDTGQGRNVLPPVKTQSRRITSPTARRLSTPLKLTRLFTIARAKTSSPKLRS
jgi:hypothetical protein